SPPVGNDAGPLRLLWYRWQWSALVVVRLPGDADLAEVVVAARSWKCGSMDPLERNPETPPAASGQDCPSIRCSMSETLPRRTECDESRTFGSVGVAPCRRVEVCRLGWRPRQSLASSREPSLAWRPVTAVAKRRQGGCRP